MRLYRIEETKDATINTNPKKPVTTSGTSRVVVINIIMIGLAIGAIFIRSLTIMLVEKGTLKQFLYLEHGAHWAIGTLAILMFVSTFHEVPEVVTGLLGLLFIGSSLYSSIKYNKISNKD